LTFERNSILIHNTFVKVNNIIQNNDTKYMQKLEYLEKNYNTLVDLHEQTTTSLVAQLKADMLKVTEHSKHVQLQNNILKNRLKLVEDKLKSQVDSRNEVFTKLRKEQKGLNKAILSAKENISSKLDSQFNNLKLCSDKLNEHCDRQVLKNKELERMLKQKLLDFHQVLDDRDMQSQTHENLIMGMLSNERLK